MNKLPQVFLILTALGLGIITGHHEWKLDKQKEEQAAKLAGTRKEVPEVKVKFRDDSGGCIDSTGGWDFQKREENEKPPEKKESSSEKVNQHEKEPKKEKEPSFKPELEKIDLLMDEASTYLNIATIDVNLRNEFAKSAYDCTSKALDIFGKFSEKTQNNTEFQQRLKAITEVRHAAMKLAPIDK